MKRIILILIVLFPLALSAQKIGNISNGESGSSVRGKLNQVVDSVNTYEDSVKTGILAFSDSLKHTDGTWTKGTINASDIVELVKTRKINVDINGKGNFTTIKEACDSIYTSGSDSLNRWLIEVGNGFFDENNPINIPSYTLIKTIGKLGGSVVTAQNSGDLFRFSDLSSIDGFSIIGADKAFAMDSVGDIRITNIIANSCDTVLSLTNGAAFIEDIFISTQIDKTEVAIGNYGGTLTSNNTYITSVTDEVGVIFDLEGQSFTTITNLVSFSPLVDTALHATDTARATIYSSSIVSVNHSIVAETYSDIRVAGAAVFRSQNEYQELTGASVSGFGLTDRNDDAFQLFGTELHVGTPGNSVESCFGEGDSYSDRILVYTWNGSTWENETDSAKTIDGKGFGFPNTSINTAIYFASDIDTSIHHGFKLSMIDSMTAGSGVIVLEYWDGSTWTEFNGMVKDGNAPFAYHAKAYFEQTQNTHTLYNIKMTNDDWTANDPMSLGEVKKWVRARISTAITTSPNIDQVKLHPSRSEINQDGTMEYFGDSRYTQLLQLNIGSGSPIEGNMQSQDIYVDENVGVGFQSNRFTATGDILGFPINFPDNIDTSSPISFVWSGRATSGSNIQWTARSRIVPPGSAGTLYTTEPTASGETEIVLTVTRLAVIGDNEIFSASFDVSEALPTRVNGFGDQLWITIQPTTLTGQFDLTNVGAAYYAHILGGHE